jgi:hypothetical protein
VALAASQWWDAVFGSRRRAGGDDELIESLGELNELLGQIGASVARLRKALPGLIASLKRRARRRSRR